MRDTDDHHWLNQGSTSSAEVKKTYDDWAAGYDDSMAGWDYRAPNQAAAYLRAEMPPASLILDAGCGTGLTGAALRAAGFTGPIDGIDKNEKLLLVCAKGKRGYFLKNRLKHYGYTNTKVLEGGFYFTDVKVENPVGTIPPEEIKRVKGLGCLQDKRYP
ncbi:MAG: hypothetical protein GY769_16935, partial [bacterium]|nr:hypothetical protein [bacterium]